MRIHEQDDVLAEIAATMTPAEWCELDDTTRWTLYDAATRIADQEEHGLERDIERMRG